MTTNNKRYVVGDTDDNGYQPLIDTKDVVSDDYCFVCLTEPEDRNFWRDLAPVVDRLNEQDARIHELRAKLASKPIDFKDKNRYFACYCPECGWIGMSDDSAGGHAIADTGDYDDVICPNCDKRNKRVPVEDADIVLQNYHNRIKELEAENAKLRKLIRFIPEGFSCEYCNHVRIGCYCALFPDRCYDFKKCAACLAAFPNGNKGE